MKNFIVVIPGGFVQVGDYHTSTYYSVKNTEDATRLSQSVALTIARQLHKAVAVQIDNGE